MAVEPTIITGDCMDVLPTLEAGSANCCVTSPPYWGLRDYGVPGRVWGGDPACNHDWEASKEPGGCGTGREAGRTRGGHQPGFCQCGAWLGVLGLEPTPELFVAHMVAIFREVRRVLRDDGTLWLNLGDSYATGGGAVGRCPGGGDQGERFLRAGMINTQPNRMPIPGLKAKDLVGIPWRVAFALQADGWYLRQDIIWHKPNPMPESVTDRCTKAHEYIFLLSKSERYYFNADAIAEEASGKSGGACFGKVDKEGPGSRRISDADNERIRGEDRNRRSVWTVNVNPYKGAHFATFPPDLIKPCILAGCPEGGTVLEPFLGSGTTAAVARANGCHCVGIELNPEYMRLVNKRLQQRVLGLA